MREAAKSKTQLEERNRELQLRCEERGQVPEVSSPLPALLPDSHPRPGPPGRPEFTDSSSSSALKSSEPQTTISAH